MVLSRITSYPALSGTDTYDGEINLREELRQMFHGSAQEVPKSHRVLLRRARRDSNDRTIACPCVDELTREPDLDNTCPVGGPGCGGYLWDEEWIDVRRVYIRPSNTGFVARNSYIEPGILNVQAMIYYLEYSTVPTILDSIIEMKVNSDGAPVVPYIRHRMYKPDTIIGHRGDNGRIEFYTFICLQSDSVLIGEDSQWR